MSGTACPALGTACPALSMVSGHDRLTECVIFGFSAWGLLHRAAQQPVVFFKSPIWCIAVPQFLVIAVGAFALTSLVLWFWRQVNLTDGAVPSANYTLFVLSHVTITMVSYFLIADITYGWLFINIWHNAQYLLFVWAYNTNRYSDAIEQSHSFISWMCQPKHRYYYAFICSAIGIIIYYTLGLTRNLTAQTLLPFSLVVYQSVAFHHYIVDAVIWRASPKKSWMQRAVRNLGYRQLNSSHR